jgi:hypothetical protein
MTCSYETARIAEDGDRLAHDPEVAGSNPVPATKLKWPQRYDLWGHFHARWERIGNTEPSSLICFIVARTRLALSGV